MDEKESWGIIKETPYWVAVYKPAGMIVERSPFESPTLEELVQAHFKTKKRPPFLGIVHRLDKPTSGVVVIAKKKSALKHLNRQFQDRRVKKIYWALTEGILPAKEGKLSNWLIKDREQKRAIISEVETPSAKLASLHYRVLNEKQGKVLLEVELLTGRYHQIRAQLAAVGCPIIGDHKYTMDSDDYSKAIALHARELAFDDPQGGKRRYMIAPLPKAPWWEPFREQFE